ncbi:hypothetical protein B0J11DRAFT_500839 [Dendryphion nanum]|uniref:Uncharacterized protein n=1 Tax=Dendryphion nanum TaxID=256645 RepID=A0A9P9IYM3_9PLEO|nr:hypothetical protein B0J11DRAFT_500839 [Dendryphion nanum]
MALLNELDQLWTEGYPEEVDDYLEHCRRTRCDGNRMWPSPPVIENIVGTPPPKYPTFVRPTFRPEQILLIKSDDILDQELMRTGILMVEVVTDRKMNDAQLDAQLDAIANAPDEFRLSLRAFYWCNPARHRHLRNSSEAVMQLIQVCPNLQHIRFEGLPPDFSDFIFSSILRSCPNLVSLTLVATPCSRKLDMEMIVKILDSKLCEQVRYFELHEIISDPFLLEFFEHFSARRKKQDPCNSLEIVYTYVGFPLMWREGLRYHSKRRLLQEADWRDVKE